MLLFKVDFKKAYELSGFKIFGYGYAENELSDSLEEVDV
jgi:hypothetical protein